MSELKFRVWTGKEMDYVDNLYYFEEQGITKVEDGKAHGFFGECSIMQYTGLKDKNGKEIYEGDIVEARTFDENIDKKQVGRVTYHKGRLGYVFIPKELEKKNLYYPLFSIVTCELIGNINENPELLMS